MNPVIVLSVAHALFVGYIGYALGKSNLRIHRTLAAVTVVVAVILHGTWQLTLPHERIDAIARAVAWPPLVPTLVTIALVETAGIWAPVVLVHWAAARTRIWAAAYIVAAASFGTVAHYGPSFDPPQQPHPEYAMWLVRAFVLAAVPFAIGSFAKRRRTTIP
jgi:hypothetical protein